MGAPDPVRLPLTLHRVGERDILVSPDGNPAAAVALPLAAIECLHHAAWGRVDVTLPRALARERGLAR